MRKTFFVAALFAACAAAAPVRAADAAAAGVWTDDYETAAAASKADGLPLLLLFTDGDRDPRCARLWREALGTAAWRSWAATNVHCVSLAFPTGPDFASRRTRAVSDALARHFGVRERPALVLLEADGRRLADPAIRPRVPAAFYIRQVATIRIESDPAALRAALGDEAAEAHLAALAAQADYERGVDERRRLLDAEGARLRKLREAAPDEAARAAAEAETEKVLTERIQDYRGFQEAGLEASRARTAAIEAVRDRLVGPAGLLPRPAGPDTPK